MLQNVNSMKRLLEIELYKIFTNKTSKVLVSVYFGLLLSMALITMIKFDIGPFKFHLAKQGIFDFPLIWHFNTYVASFLKIFLAIIIVSMVSNEYANKTIKQNLIDGLSKKEFIQSKFFTVLLFSAASTLFVVGISLILGSIYSNEITFSLLTTDLQYVLAYFIKLVGFFTLCLFLGLLIKRSAFALGFLLILFIIENIVYGMLRVTGLGVELSEKISHFFPLTSMGELISEPFTRLDIVGALGEQIGETMAFNYDVSILNVCVVLAWTFIFYMLSLKLLKSRDL